MVKEIGSRRAAADPSLSAPGCRLKWAVWMLFASVVVVSDQLIQHKALKRSLQFLFTSLSGDFQSESPHPTGRGGLDGPEWCSGRDAL